MGRYYDSRTGTTRPHNYSDAQWEVYKAIYERESTERSRRGEVGDHIGNHYAAREAAERLHRRS